MSIYISEDEKTRHPFYKIMALHGDALQAELHAWSREDLIEWLSWNDRNGVYKDEEALREFDIILSKEEALEIMIRQIEEA